MSSFLSPLQDTVASRLAEVVYLLLLLLFRYFSTDTHYFVFVHKGPLILVCIANTFEYPDQVNIVVVVVDVTLFVYCDVLELTLYRPCNHYVSQILYLITVPILDPVTTKHVV